MICDIPIRCWLATIFLLAAAIPLAAEPLGTEFTYQGQLKSDGVPADGDYDFVFRLFDAETGGVQIGGDVTVPDWTVTDGLFTLQLDFGTGAFGSNARWLEIDVRESGSSDDYETLAPRHLLTATPVAQFALNGPGSGGYWTLSGNSISNNNSGYVGIGTLSPNFDLHVYRDGFTAGLVPPARLGVQRFLGVMPPGVSLNDWFTVEVGGELIGPAPGTRLVRESGTSLSFQTEDTVNSAVRSTQMTLDAEGKLGIGTTTPIALVETISEARVHGFRATTDGIPVTGIRTSTTGTWPAIHGESASAGDNATGIRGYITSTSPGTGSAGVLGHNYGTTMSGYGVKGSHAGYGTGVYGVSVGGAGVYGESTNTTGVYGKSTNGHGVYGESANGYAGYFPGTVSVKVLEITGADLAEKFPVSEEVKPGVVVAIDPKHPGQLCLARGAYNRRVAGVVSGAGGISAGTVLGNMPGFEEAPPIALSGRVWVFCDATAGAIEPGDLLTTSDTPGHAMAVTDHACATGAILGKAMTALDEGEIDMVLVLVNLQ